MNLAELDKRAAANAAEPEKESDYIIEMLNITKIFPGI